jgi:hypothetical protein
MSGLAQFAALSNSDDGFDSERDIVVQPILSPSRVQRSDVIEISVGSRRTKPILGRL